MFIQILNTWTVYSLLLIVIPRFSLGSPVENNAETMYDAVTKKCPNLEKSALKDNEIFTRKCLNWTHINSTNLFSNDTRSNVECLVFYDALVSFCTGMGDTLLKVEGVIPTTSVLKNYNYTLDTVCNSNYSIYSVNKTEHNRTSLIKNNLDCFLLCGDFTDSRVSDLCKFAYYFTNFNVSKFTHTLEAVHQKHNPAPELVKSNNSNSYGEVASEKKPVNETKIEIKDGPLEKSPVLRPDVKTHETMLVHQNPVPVKDEKESAPVMEPHLPETDIKKPPIQKEGKQNASLPIPKNDNAYNLNKPQAKEISNDEKGAPETAPEKDKKPEINEKSQQDPEENPDYPAEEKSQMVNGGPDGEVLGDDEADIEQEDGDVKPEPIIPVEQKELKTPSKKVKPSTVEDEAVSNFNTPEDDMDGDSYFFSYFTVIMCLCIVGYVGYHNRQKVLALILEGKKGRRPGRGRRPNSANYHKLDTNLEEAISSTCTKNASNVIY